MAFSDFTFPQVQQDLGLALDEADLFSPMPALPLREDFVATVTDGATVALAVKATGAPSYSSEAYPYRNIHQYPRQIYDAFGPERMFCGTDITRMPCSWRQCVTLFTEELPWLSARDQELIMGRALCTWFDWKLPG